MQSDKRTQMGEYEFSILLREGESLLLFCGNDVDGIADTNFRTPKIVNKL